MNLESEVNVESEITAAVIELEHAELRLTLLTRRPGRDDSLAQLTRDVRETRNKLWQRVINKAA